MRHPSCRVSATTLRPALRRFTVLLILMLAAGAVFVAPAFATGGVGGFVYDQFADPIDQVHVDLYLSLDGGATWVWGAGGMTDATGAYFVVTTYAGLYKAIFYDDLGLHVSEWWNDTRDEDQATVIPLGEDEVRMGVNAALAMAGRAGGVVTDTEGAPLEGIRVDGFRWSDQSQSWVGTSQSYSEAGGAWTAGGLPPGQYRFHFRDENGGVYADQFYDRQKLWDSAHTVGIEPSANADWIDAELEVGAQIGGVVQDEWGGPIADVQVTAYQYDPATGQWPGARMATTDDFGAYVLGPLASGQYRVSFDGGPSWISEWYDDRANDWDADFIPVNAGDSAVADATLTQAGSISGTVVADGSGDPLEGMAISLYRWNGWDWWQVEGGWWFTNGEGFYTVGGLDPGSYRVQFIDPNGGWATEYYDDVPGSTGPTEVVVFGGLTTTVDASLAQAGQIAGYVRDPDMNPLQGIDIWTFLFLGEGFDNPWDCLGAAQTDETGYFAIGGLRAGTYSLELVDGNGVYAEQVYEDALNAGEGIDLVVTAGETTWAYPVLERGGRIYGQVVDAAGNGVANVLVIFNGWVDDPEGGHWEWYTECWTDEQGDFSKSGLQARPTLVLFQDDSGQYLEEFYDDARDEGAATPVDVQSGRSRNLGQVELAEAGHVAGTVNEAGGGALENVEVTIARWNDDWQDWDHFAGAMTDAEGGYDVGGLAAGAYRVQFRDPAGLHITEWYEDAPDAWSAQDVSVTAGGTTQIDAALEPGCVIEGHIRDGDGNPIAGVDAQVWYYEPGDWLYKDYMPYGGSSVSDDTGYYRLEGLPPRTYQLRLVASDLPDAWGVEVYDDARVVGTGTDLLPAPGVTLVVDPVLDAGGRLTGTLRDDETYDPLAFAFPMDVRVWSWVEDAGLPGGGEWRMYAELATGEESGGVIHGQSLAPGTYRVSFGCWTGSYLGEWWEDQPDVELATPVAILSGETTDLGDVLLMRSAMILGTVTGPDGEPREGVHVRAREYLEGEWREVSGFDTWADGTYFIGNLSGGTYRLEFDGRDIGLAREFWSDQASALGAFDIVLDPREEASGYDAQLGGTGALEGTVRTAGGDPVPDVTVRIAVWDENADRYVQLDEERSEVLVDGEGAWHLEDVSPGTYRVWSSPSVNDYGEGVVEGIVVATGETTWVDIVPPRAGSVAGTVTAIGGAPVEDAFVMLLKYYPEDLAWWGTGIETHTLANGTYVLPTVTPGTYRIVFVPPVGSGLAEESWDNRAIVEIAHDLTIAENEDIADIDAVLGPAADAEPPSPPEVTGADDAWHAEAVRLDFSATDDLSGVAEYECVVDDGEWADGDHVVVPAPADHSNDGVHDVYVRAIDNVGHVGDTVQVQVKIDTTGPVVSDDDPGTWLRGPVTVNLTGVDAGCGVVDHLEYGPTDEGPWQVGSSFTLATWKRGGGSGERTTWVRGIDGLGNASDPAPVVVRIDGRAPVTTDDSDGSPHADDVTVHLTLNDAHSGPGWTYFSVDGGMWMIGDTIVIPALAGGQNDGVHWITFYSVDAVGNVEQAVQTCAVVIDVPGVP